MLDISLKNVPMEQLADAVRAEYRAVFTQAVAEGRALPLVLPYSLLGPFIVPTLWLAIPHSRNPWMWRARWLVVVYVVAFDLDLIWHTSSTNMACAYATGLMAFWGIISTLNALLWTQPQVEAARIVKRVKRDKEKVNGHPHHDEGPQENGLRRRKQGETGVSSEAQGHHTTKIQYEYVWQPFPENGPFFQRLNWALDMTTNFRFAGWNWSISSIPRPKIEPPSAILHGSLVDMDSMPVVTKAGYRRCLTESDLIWSRLRDVTIMYLLLDFLATFMTKDPFFVLGPDHPHDHLLPTHLRCLRPWALHAYRQVFSLGGVISAISGAFNLNDLVQYFVMRHLFPMRGELWQHSSTFGSFSQVLDRGLAGWWGGCWHQTFRLQFVAPATWLVRQGYVDKGTYTAILAGLAVAYIQSGLLHASGSVSSIPRTKAWRAPVFFVLQLAGVILQRAVSVTAKKYLPPLPRRLTEAINLTFTLAWLYMTAGVFINDLASAGIWLLEPVPFSFFRAFGFGYPGERWWRWDENHWPRWYSAEHWWQSGIAL